MHQVSIKTQCCKHCKSYLELCSCKRCNMWHTQWKSMLVSVSAILYAAGFRWRITENHRPTMPLYLPAAAIFCQIILCLVLTSMYWIYGSVLRLKFNRLVSRQNCKPVQHNKVKITWYTCIQFHRLINLDPGIHWQVFAF